MQKSKVCDLIPGHGINHPKYGYMQYRGLVTKNPYTEEPKVPHEYLFWLPVDENGDTQPDVVLKDGQQTVEIVDAIWD